MAVVCVLVLGAVLVISSDGGGDDDRAAQDVASATSAPPVSLPFEPDPGTVYAVDNAFGPADVAAAAGDTVMFENADRVAHTFTDDEGRFDSESVEPGGRYGFAYAEPGRYTFHCEIHPSMRGAVEIGPVEP